MTAAATAAGGPSRSQRLGFLIMVVGMFMAILDIQIVASSIAEIAAGIGASYDQISWVQTSYLIAEVIMIPLSGWLSRAFSTRLLFTASAIGFTVASALCALAWDLPSMVAFRVLQGALGAAMIPTVFATSFSLFPESERAKVSVVIGLVATAAPTLGPTLGGWISQVMGWHWLFLINVVPGLLVATGVWLLMDIDRGDRRLLKGIDWLGIAATAAFLGSVEFVLEEGPRHDWLADAAVRNLALVAAAAGVVFFWRGLTAPNRVVDLTAFADRNFALGCAFSFVIGVGLYGSVYLLPQYLAQVRHFDSLQIGLVMMSVGGFQMLSAPIAGGLSKTMDPRLMLAMGLALFGGGLWLTAGLVTSHTGSSDLVLPNALRGLALMFCFLPINLLALGNLAPDRLKNASGLYNLMRNLGGAVGLAAINQVVMERFALHEARLAEKVAAGSPAAESWLAGAAERLSGRLGESADAGALQLLAQTVRREALTLTFADAFLLVAAVFAAAFLLMPLMKKVVPAGGAAAPGGDGH